jgi:hypothetical protein
LTRKRIHVVSFDVPYPPSYGGVIDVFYKAKALRDAGVDIHMHAFMYGRKESPELNTICKTVHYYTRKTDSRLLLSRDPYIIASRRSDLLLKNLASNDAPILFEGLHTCAYLSAPELERKKKLVRTHNIEHDYYRALADVEKRFTRRWYFRREARKLQQFEENLACADHVLAISPADARTLGLRYRNVKHIMAFHPYEEVLIRAGRGDFALYHGNLEVGENNQAAMFLVNEVFNDLDYKLVIAGNKPSDELIKAVKGKRNIALRANISTDEIDELVAGAHVNVLPTFQATGIKLKLLAALFRGRFCLVNPPMVANTGVESLCTIAETAPAFKSRLHELFEKDFESSEIAARSTLLPERFSNKANAEKILSLI